MARDLITGGAGFIGSHIAEELVRRGESVRVLDDLSNRSEGNLLPILDRIDFRHDGVCDVHATVRSCVAPAVAGTVINVGTGVSSTLNQTISLLNPIFGVRTTPRRAQARPGEARNSTADISWTRALLRYEPVVPFDDGPQRRAVWFRSVKVRV